MVTFSGLLNALDGVASSEERIIFMTTNHIERLDSALIRPGRVDIRVLVGDASESQIKRMFLRFYPDSEALSYEFVKALTVNGQLLAVSAAQIQGHFVIYRDDAQAAVNNAYRLIPQSANLKMIEPVGQANLN